MAHIGKWGTFIHIPKCGGAWVRYHLRENYGRGEECGPTHSWPHPYLKKKNRPGVFLPQPPYFTFIRHPATWLRSFYHYSGKRKWNEDDRGFGHWGMLTYLTTEFRDCTWEDFVERVCSERTGLVTWFFKSYMFPGLQVGRMEDFPYSLQKVTGLFIEAEPANTQDGLPEIDPHLWNMIELAERPIIDQYYDTYAENDYHWEKYEYPSKATKVGVFMQGAKE